MSSEEKISPEEFDKELESLLTGTPEKKPKNQKRKKIIIAAAIAILGITGIKLLSGGKDMVPVVDTVTPTRKTIQNRLTVTGPISGTDSVDVVSNLHAEILEIPVKEGDKVTKGQPLAVLDDSDVKKEADIAKNDYDLAVTTCAEKDKEARNGYAKAIQDLNTAQANYDRTKALFDGGSVPKVDLETAENGLHDAERECDSYTIKNGSAVADDSYRLQIEKAKFDYEKAVEQLDNTILKAPIDGTVVRVNTKVGRFADKMENDAPLFVIENLDNLELEIKVSEYTIGKVAVGQEAEISADILNGETVHGEVISISPTGEEKGGGSSERVIPTKIRVTDQDTKLIAGITARASIVLEESENALTVPVSAVMEKDGTNYVQEISDGTVSWVPVDIGVESDVEMEIIPVEGNSLDENSVLIAEPGEQYTGAIRVMGLKKINLTIHRGEFVAIMGHSGSGKSTLMNILGCLDRPTLGHYYLDGIDTAALSPDELSAVRNKKIGFVFQSFNLISRTSALKNVELPMTYARIPKRKRTERAMELLECVGLEKRAGHMPNEMSGGQRQRVAIARALANEPPLILADEPTGNLDTAASIEIMEIFSELHKAGATVIVVTHEENIAAFTDRIIHFSDGQIIKDEINENPTKGSGKVHMKGLYRHFQETAGTESGVVGC